MIEPREFLSGRIRLFDGDCMDVLRALPDNSIDSCVTDPPYHLTSIVKRFGAAGAAPAQFGTDGAFARASRGFMNQKWDAPDDIEIDPSFANWFAGFVDGEGCFHVHKKKVNGCETYDCQFSITLRDDDAPIVNRIKESLGGIGSISFRGKASGKAGQNPQVRYCISSKADCMRLRAVLCVFPLRAKKLRDFEIWCDALDAWVSHEPGSSWADMAYFRENLMAVRQYGSKYHPTQIWAYKWAVEILRVLKPGGHIVAFGGSRTFHRLVSGIEDAGFEIRDTLQWIYATGFPKSHNLKDDWQGWGTALKPSCEPICLARKPLSEKTVAANVLKWGTGALNIDGCRVATDDAIGVRNHNVSLGAAKSAIYGNAGAFVSVPSPEGRWPANIIHDGSDEVVAMFPNSNGQQGDVRGTESSHTGDENTNCYGEYGRVPFGKRDDSGSAARFFYSAKADAADRLASKHPTVKPVDLMRWLCRLITPPGGMTIDPFSGTGTTGQAAFLEGFSATLIEREAEYVADIERRMALVLAGPEERARKLLDAKGQTQDETALPLFGGLTDA